MADKAVTKAKPARGPAEDVIKLAPPKAKKAVEAADEPGFDAKGIVYIGQCVATPMRGADPRRETGEARGLDALRDTAGLAR